MRSTTGPARNRTGGGQRGRRRNTGIRDQLIQHDPADSLRLLSPEAARLLLGRDTDIPDDVNGLPYGAVFLAVLVLVAWRLDRDVDAPVRKVLRRWFVVNRTDRALSPAARAFREFAMTEGERFLPAPIGPGEPDGDGGGI